MLINRRQALKKSAGAAGVAGVGLLSASAFGGGTKPALAQVVYAVDSEVVHLLGSETIVGTKTFTTEPIFPVAKVPVIQNQVGPPASPEPTSVFTVVPADPERAPFTFLVHGTSFLGTWDTVMSVGYNIANGGGPAVSAEPQMIWQVETNYRPTATQRSVECFFQYKAPGDAFTIRPFFVQFDRDAANPAAALMLLSLQGPLSVLAPGGGSTMFSLSHNVLSVEASNPAGGSAINVKAAPGKTASLCLGFNGVDFKMILQPISPDIGGVVVGGTPALFIGAKPKGMAGSGLISVGGYDNVAVGNFMVASSAADTIGIVSRGRVGQLGSLLEVRDAPGTTLSRFDKNGYFMTRKRSEPPDTDIASGELAIWFDPSATAPSLQIKAKLLNGSVRRGTIPLEAPQT